ncbi:hypothetical protein Tco_1520009, partial [Tanacetum coccineum]
INLIPEPITTESENTTPTSNSPDSPVTDDYPIITQPDEPEQAEPLFDKEVLNQIIPENEIIIDNEFTPDVIPLLENHLVAPIP